MICDYILDLQSLLDDVRNCEESFFWFKRFLQVVSIEAGRLVVDAPKADITRHYLSAERMKSVEVDPEALRVRRVIDLLLTQLPGGPCPIVSSELNVRRVVTKSAVDYDSALVAMQQTKPRVDFFVYNKRKPIYGKRERQIFGYKGIREYFGIDCVGGDCGETKRIQRQGKQTVVDKLGMDESFSGCIESFEFRRQIQQFAQGEDCFSIIDKYLFGGDKIASSDLPSYIDDRMDILVAWMGLLTSDKSIHVPFSFNVYTQRSPGMTDNLIESYLRKKWGTNRPKCRIRFVFIGGSDAFHDRFVCSKSNYFAIGRGLDGFDSKGVKKMFNIYYCGRISNERIPKDVKQIMAIESADQLTCNV